MKLSTGHATWGESPQFFSASNAELSRELLVSALFSTSCGVTVADVRQSGAPLILCNPAFLRLTGYTSAEVLGRNCRFLQGPDTDPDRIQAIREALREGRHLRVVLKNYRKDGLPFWNELNLSPIFDGGGTLTHFVGVQNDITPQMRAEEALRTLNGELDARVKERTHDLSEALKLVATSREQALWIVGLALEYRDYETKGHTERVTALAGRLGQALGLSGGELSDLRWGSYLHDAGKVALPDAVLLKPGPLTAEEFKLMRRHVLIGQAMLQELTFLPVSVLEVVRYHHERWDGGGYLEGLAGEQIPRLARVFSVADVYDALTSVRPYKAAWSHEEAVAEISRGRGTQFDPQVVDVFVETVGC